MVLRVVLIFVCMILLAHVHADPFDTIRQLRQELRQNIAPPHEFMIYYVCPLIATPEFVKQANDYDLTSAVVDELGFGALGVKNNSWAAKYQVDPYKNSRCFSAMYLAATSDMAKTQIAGMKKIIRRCCLTDTDYDL